MGPYFKPEKETPELEGFRALAKEYFKKTEGLPMAEIKSGLLELILTKGEIIINDGDTFPYHIAGSGDFFDYRVARVNKIREEKLKSALAEFADGQKALLYTGDVDFSHTVPDWDRVLKIGFPGILAALEERLGRGGINAEQERYMTCAVRVYKAVLVYLGRLAESCEKNGGYDRPAKAYRALAVRQPQTMYEVLAFMVVFYFLQEKLDTELLRSMGGLDELLLPYYKNDVASGISEKQLDEDIAAFMLQLREFGFINNIPFYICRTDFEGHTYCNEMTYRLVSIYSTLNVQDPKIQVRCGRDIPDDLMALLADTIRKGNNSIVFMNDGAILPALESLGFDRADCEAYTPVGCYEPSARGELACTCAARISLLKAVELTLSNGVDRVNRLKFEENICPIDTWDGFYKSFLARVASSADAVRRIMAIYEAAYEDINPSLIFSPTFESCVESATDIYAGSAKYNSTSVNVFGIASAVDTLTAIRRAVYEDRLVSAERLDAILASDWAGEEKLRLRCLKKYPKYGSGEAETDALARQIVDDVSPMINGVRNTRGGVFRLGMFSIDWYMMFGEKIGATADGRHSGEIISKNMCAAIGRDTSGVTGVLRSAAAADGKKIPNGTVLDLVLDASAAKGEDGIRAMTGIVRSFFALGGFGIQINVLDPEMLRRAKAHPEEYASLQVRLCGWNVYFTELSEREQDEFIAMAENAAC